MGIRDDPKKDLHDMKSFVDACNLVDIHNFTYSSAPLTDVIKKNAPWRKTSWGEECFQELKKKKTSSNCLGVPHMVLITDACDNGGRGVQFTNGKS